ncbi:hypothetical protein GCM10010269_69830 [Streptomyces humidus]|uniref:Uncharacterized protein n=1 Tax=Streptomyces humidus TaxID=52259 RepID=A0A918L8Z7_9ACTN|nr:hypothetical protein GCM10010269_69830 [Streptomyces humidus]
MGAVAEDQLVDQLVDELLDLRLDRLTDGPVGGPSGGRSSDGPRDALSVVACRFCGLKRPHTKGR